MKWCPLNQNTNILPKRNEENDCVCWVLLLKSSFLFLSVWSLIWALIGGGSLSAMGDSQTQTRNFSQNYLESELFWLGMSWLRMQQIFGPSQWWESFLHVCWNTTNQRSKWKILFRCCSCLLRCNLKPQFEIQTDQLIPFLRTATDPWEWFWRVSRGATNRFLPVWFCTLRAL